MNCKSNKTVTITCDVRQNTTTPFCAQLCDHSINVTAVGNAQPTLQAAGRHGRQWHVFATASVHLCVLLSCPQLLEHLAQGCDGLRVAAVLYVCLQSIDRISCSKAATLLAAVLKSMLTIDKTLFFLLCLCSSCLQASTTGTLAFTACCSAEACLLLQRPDPFACPMHLCGPPPCTVVVPGREGTELARRGDTWVEAST